MRNLRLTDQIIITNESLATCQAVTFENEGNYFFANTDAICKLNVQSGDIENLLPLATIDGADQVLDVKHHIEDNSISVVTASGSVAVFNVETCDVEIVGDVAGGIEACCWSPDNETFVLVTSAKKILLMTRTWDVLTEVLLFEEAFGEGQFVTVGWGSKETQFHGSEGKNARVKQEVVSQVSNWDDRKPRITWRADGQFFAVNAVDPSFGYRLLRIFSREGVLQFTSEDVFQLEQSLSWKSTGASGLITTTVTMKQPVRQQVAFFEKNGLRHGEFDLQSGTQVLESFWNNDSSILALVLRYPAGNGEMTNAVQLWTTSNYHWYLKKETNFGTQVRVLNLVWDPMNTGRLHLVLSDGQYRRLDFTFVVDRSNGLDLIDDSCVTVIDGCTLKLTPFRKSVIPPPMSAYEIRLPSAVSQVGFLCNPGDTLDSNSFFAVTADNQMYFFAKSRQLAADGCVTVREGLESEMYTKIATMTLPAEFYHLTWTSPETAVAACAVSADGRFWLNVLTLSVSGDNSSCIISATVTVPDRIASISGSFDARQAFVQLVTGELFSLDLSSNQLNFFAALPEPCTQVSRALEILNEPKLVALSDSGRLYVNGMEIMSSINSFALHSHFLLCTSTQQHELICLGLDTLAGSSPPHFVARRVERGSRLIHSTAMGTCTVLQMPRGNLEAIHPRPLTIHLLKDLMDRHKYLDAFTLMKKQRINMNLLCDHSSADFLTNLALFVEQLGSSVANLNLFLTDLTEEDFTLTMYADYYRDRSPSTFHSGGKVDAVCTALREEMRKANNKKYVSAILTSYVKMSTPDLAGALRTIQNIASEGGKDEALKYLTVLVDADKLYNEALATYDLQLTLMVAQRSQKDPKEYLPFLNELNAVTEESLRKFRIDNHLRRYESAVRNLCQSRPIQATEIVNYVKLHRLYGLAMDELINCEEPEAAQVVSNLAPLYADSLEAKGDFEEAAYVYQRANLPQKAVNCFSSALMWKPCLTLAQLLNYGEEEVRQLASKLASRLRSTKRNLEAAHIYEHHMNDVDSSLNCLVEGHLFQDAWILSQKVKRQDWIGSTLKSAVEEALDATADRLDRLEGEFDRFVSRLGVIRTTLQEKKLTNDTPDVHGDLYSDAGSTIASSNSMSSGKTFRSAKNRRKMERRKFQLKEGSQWEDFAIIHAIYNQLVSLPSLVGEVSSLVRGSVLILCDWSRPRHVQSKLEKLLRHMDQDKKKVWSFEVVDKPVDGEELYGPQATTEFIVHQKTRLTESNNVLNARYRELDPQYYFPPEVRLDADWKLSLLR